MSLQYKQLIVYLYQFATFLMCCWYCKTGIPVGFIICSCDVANSNNCSSFHGVEHIPLSQFNFDLFLFFRDSIHFFFWTRNDFSWFLKFLFHAAVLVFRLVQTNHGPIYRTNTAIMYRGEQKQIEIEQQYSQEQMERNGQLIFS